METMPRTGDIIRFTRDEREHIGIVVGIDNRILVVTHRSQSMILSALKEFQPVSWKSLDEETQKQFDQIAEKLQRRAENNDSNYPD